MKKLFTIAIALLAINIYAQKITFGAKAGLNFSKLKVDAPEYEKYPSITSFQIGVTSKKEISELFSIQAELLFSPQGTSYEYKEGGDIVDESELLLNYINLPLMAIYDIGKGFSIEAGPQIGFLISAEEKYDGETFDRKKDLNSTDFSFNFGLGYKLNKRTSLGLRLNKGLTNIIKDQDESFEDDGDYIAKNSVVQLSVNYIF